MEKSEKKGEDGAKWDAAEWFLPIFNSPTRLLRHVILLSKKVFCCHNWLDFPWEVFPFNGSRALYMGELRKNTTSTKTITKKKPGYFGKIETVGTKKIFLWSKFFLFLD